MSIDARIVAAFSKRVSPEEWIESVVASEEEREVLELKAKALCLQDLSFYDERSDVFHLLPSNAYVVVLPMVMRSSLAAIDAGVLGKYSLLSLDSVVDWLGQPVCPDLFSKRFINVWGKMSISELCVAEDWLWYVLDCGYRDEDGVARALEMLEYLKGHVISRKRF